MNQMIYRQIKRVLIGKHRYIKTYKHANPTLAWYVASSLSKTETNKNCKRIVTDGDTKLTLKKKYLFESRKNSNLESYINN